MTSYALRQLADEAKHPATKAALDAALGRAEATEKCMAPDAKPGIRIPKALKMTQTEAEYERVLRDEYRCADYRFEFQTISLRLKSGARYTPDWIVWYKSAICAVVEVKGKYRLGSAGRANLAFKTAIVEFPHLCFRYAEKGDNGQWKIAHANQP